MQIGIRLHDTKKGTLEERVAIAEEQGFSCAHLALKKVISEYSVADSALTPGFSCYLKNLFAAHHLDIAVLGCYLNLATPDQAVLEKNVHRYMAHIRMASLLGAGVVGTETGAVNESYVLRNGITRKRHWIFLSKMSDRSGASSGKNG